jgi:FkbM family methyltransferase
LHPAHWFLLGPDGNALYHLHMKLVATAAGAKNVMKFVWEHPSNDGQRTRALLRAVRFQVRGRVLHRRTLARLGKKSMIWADLHRTGASMVVYANPPNYHEMLIWRNHLRPGDLFVDVGANVGSYAIWAAELGAQVIALEPAEDTFALLQENVVLNGYSIRTIRAAAGAAPGTARFTSGQDAVNRLDPDGPAEIAMITIDSVIGDHTVAGMKVDVEGFEIEVLRGCERALSEQRVRLIQLEWNSTSMAAVGTDRGPVAHFLAKYGYSLYCVEADGSLAPLTDFSFGPDVFACPSALFGQRKLHDHKESNRDRTSCAAGHDKLAMTPAAKLIAILRIVYLAAVSITSLRMHSRADRSANRAASSLAAAFTSALKRRPLIPSFR